MKIFLIHLSFLILASCGTNNSGSKSNNDELPAQEQKVIPDLDCAQLIQKMIQNRSNHLLETIHQLSDYVSEQALNDTDQLVPCLDSKISLQCHQQHCTYKEKL